jgi:hypothetical protein
MVADGLTRRSAIFGLSGAAVAQHVEAAVHAESTAMASSNFFGIAKFGSSAAAIAAAEASTAIGQPFSVDDGVGNLIIYERTLAGSVEIGRMLTSANLASASGLERIGTAEGVNAQLALFSRSRTAANRIALAALPDPLLGQTATLGESGREGLFTATPYDEIADLVDEDVFQGVFVRSTTSPEVVWRRVVDGWINVRWFGAVGSGDTDNWAAFTAALNFAGSKGGGNCVFVPPGNYRIKSGLRIPSYVGLRGASPSRYPYAAGNTGVSKIIADFANPNQWVLDTSTKNGGRYIPYNEIVKENLPDETCFNCSVQDILITSVNLIPYGGIRMAGAPGSIVRDVCVYRVGCGLLVNHSFGGEFAGHFHTWYYGVVMWGEANANSLNVYCARHANGDVPRPYLLGFWAEMGKKLTEIYKLSTNDHRNRSIGILLGSPDGSTTVNVRINEATLERFSDGFLTVNAYSTFIGAIYIEGGVDVVKHGFIATHSTFFCASIHQFLSGTGFLFDFGSNVDGYINYNGSAYAEGFGQPPAEETTSEIRLGTLKPGFMSVKHQFNLKFPDKDGDWIAPDLTVGADLGAPNNPFAYRITRDGKVEFRGGLVGVSTGDNPFTLPPGFRPFYTQMLIGFRGTADVQGCRGTPEDAGKFVITSGGPTIIFDGVKPFDQIC